MIVDIFENWALYFSGDAWKAVPEFLANLDENSADGEYPLIGNDVFARVMSYQTKSSNEVAFEAHKEYINIQTVLVGAEGMAWQPASSMTVSQPYDAAKDVEFYLMPRTFSLRVDLTKEKFVAFFPSDAHAGQLHVEGMPAWIKKVVVKVRTSYYLKTSISQ